MSEIKIKMTKLILNVSKRLKLKIQTTTTNKRNNLIKLTVSKQILMDKIYSLTSLSNCNRKNKINSNRKTNQMMALNPNRNPNKFKILTCQTVTNLFLLINLSRMILLMNICSMNRLNKSKENLLLIKLKKIMQRWTTKINKCKRKCLKMQIQSSRL